MESSAMRNWCNFQTQQYIHDGDSIAAMASLLQTKDRLLLPVPRPNHWALLYINLTTKTVDYMDTYFEGGESYLRAVGRLLTEAYASLGLEHRSFTYRCTDHSGTGINTIQVPRQTTGDDSGVFVCMFAGALCTDRPITECTQ